MKLKWRYRESIILMVLFSIIYFVDDNFNIIKCIVDLSEKSLRITLYATIAQIMGALLAIVIAGLTILLTMEKSTSMKLLKRSPFYKELFDIFLISINKFAIGTATSIFLMIIDSKSEAKIFCFYILLFMVVNCSVSVWRCIWILKNVIKLQI